MEEYKDISRGLKMLLDKAEEMGWNWEAYIEPDNRRTYVEIGQSSPAGEDFSMRLILMKRTRQTVSRTAWNPTTKISTSTSILKCG